MSLILQRFKNEIREDFLEAAVQKHLLEAIKQEKLQPLDHPHVHDLTYNDGEPLKFTAEFEVLPELNLSNYRGLEIEQGAGGSEGRGSRSHNQDDARADGSVPSG